MIRKYDFTSKHVSKPMSLKMICPVYGKPSDYFYSHLIYLVKIGVRQTPQYMVKYVCFSFSFLITLAK